MLFVYRHIYIYIGKYTLYTYTHTYIHTYIHTYMHTYIQTYMHRYIHTYIHTYIHITRRHQTRDFHERDTSAPSELGDKFATSRETEPLLRSFCGHGSRSFTEVARLVPSGYYHYHYHYHCYYYYDYYY